MEGGPALGLTAAWLISSAIFGFGHLYQGALGMIATALGGAVLGLMAILTGDLLLPIVVHALLDASILFAYRPQTDDPMKAVLLAQGYDIAGETPGRTADVT